MNLINTTEPAAGEQHQENRGLATRATRIELPFVKLDIPLPPWAATALAVLVIAAVAALGYYTIVYPHQRRDEAIKRDAQSVDSFTFQQLNESQKHAGESPERSDTVFQDDIRGELNVAFFKKDNCLLLTRRPADGNGPAVKLWVMDLSRPGLQPAPGRVDRGAPTMAIPGLLQAAGRAQICRQGRCPDDHPGRFSTRNGEKRGCWIQVWREWPDGCRQYQWFNSCYSYWDEKNRRPTIYWTCCNHP